MEFVDPPHCGLSVFPGWTLHRHAPQHNISCCNCILPCCSLDTEGSEAAILNATDFDKIDVRVMTVEVSTPWYCRLIKHEVYLAAQMLHQL